MKLNVPNMNLSNSPEEKITWWNTMVVDAPTCRAILKKEIALLKVKINCIYGATHHYPPTPPSETIHQYQQLRANLKLLHNTTVERNT